MTNNAKHNKRGYFVWCVICIALMWVDKMEDLYDLTQIFTMTEHVL